MADDCRNCKWANWQMTNHNPPRINIQAFGKCSYSVPIPSLPAVLADNGYGPSKLDLLLNGSHSRAIWSDSAYVDCPVWEKKGN